MTGIRQTLGFSVKAPPDVTMHSKCVQMTSNTSIPGSLNVTAIEKEINGHEKGNIIS